MEGIAGWRGGGDSQDGSCEFRESGAGMYIRCLEIDSARPHNSAPPCSANPSLSPETRRVTRARVDDERLRPRDVPFRDGAVRDAVVCDLEDSAERVGHGGVGREGVVEGCGIVRGVELEDDLRGRAEFPAGAG